MLKLFIKCSECNTTHFISFLKHNNYVCSKCNLHFRVDADTWIKILCDKKKFDEIDRQMKSADPLGFPKYPQRQEKAIAETKRNEAIVTGTAIVGGYKVGLGIMEPNFIMASMGSVVGEKVTRLLEMASEQSLPVILIIASGGARMHEGIFSLMQMTKTSAAVRRLNESGQPLFTVLTNPTTGGVTASYAMLGNVILGEPKALIGFAGPRVIQQTIGQKLPSGFQRSEFLLEHGMLDKVVGRKEIKAVLTKLLAVYTMRIYPN
jgi:acetyl-CoA carboxylase carboxyl transferase subunit beta